MSVAHQHVGAHFIGRSADVERIPLRQKPNALPAANRAARLDDNFPGLRQCVRELSKFAVLANLIVRADDAQQGVERRPRVVVFADVGHV